LRRQYGPARTPANCNPRPAQAIRLDFCYAAKAQFPVRQPHARIETPDCLLDRVAPGCLEAGASPRNFACTSQMNAPL
jgi:hypothetical protein